MKKKLPKKKTHSQLKKELDRVFSIYIRQRDKGTCYTCGIKKEWKEMQNGHYVPRQYMSLRYSEINCNCQCYVCNVLYNGPPSAYAMRLQTQHGKEILETLELKRKEIVKDFPFLENIAYYKALIGE
jgi:hypothetical protein